MIATPQLTVAQLRTREACEEDIRNGIDSIKTHMKRIGQALAVIRDDRLYLSTHGSFEAYVDDVWKLSRARAYQLIGHASVIANLSQCEMLSTIVDTLPEAATRELSGLEPEEQCEVVLKASNNGETMPTAPMIREAKRVNAEACTPAESGSEIEQVDDNHVMYILRAGTFQKCANGFSIASQAIIDPNSIAEIRELSRSVLFLISIVKDHLEHCDPGRAKILQLVEA